MNVNIVKNQTAERATEQSRTDQLNCWNRANRISQSSEQELRGMGLLHTGEPVEELRTAAKVAASVYEDILGI
jgi:hypothetical protein